MDQHALTNADLALALSRHWDGLAGAQITAHNGGMGSSTWFVDQGSTRWVAKAVAPQAGRQFAGGLEIATQLERAGMRAGAPVPARTGQLAVEVGNCWLALLTWVPGEPLTGKDAAEQSLIGGTLAQVHVALRHYRLASAERFHWVDPAAGYLSLRPWLRPAVSAAIAELNKAGVDDMIWGLLHADPGPGAFRYERETRQCGVIDWSYAVAGPLLYDLASAVMYVGGPLRAGPLIDSYLHAGPLGRTEVVDGMPAMLRFRWAVQANYFAWRIATDDLTGISGPEENEAHLEDARLFLLA